MEEISLAALPSGYDSDNDLGESGDENEDEDEGGDEDEDDNGESLRGPFGPMGRMTDFNANPIMNPPEYDRNLWFDTSNMRYDFTSSESLISAGEAKAINTLREYQYYPGPMYETQGDRIDLFNPRPERDSVASHMATRLDVQGGGSNGSQILDSLLADASSTHDPTDERPVTSKDHGLFVSPRYTPSTPKLT